MVSEAEDEPSYWCARQRYIDWLVNLFCWDGLLPFAVITAPKFVRFMLPMRPGALELTFVVVPITAFVMRYLNGRMRFQSGQMYLWQLFVFFLAIFVLFVLVALLILWQMVNARKAAPDVLFLCAMYLSYVTLIAIALFPACSPAASEIRNIQSDF
jgi:hypothetical protein